MYFNVLCGAYFYYVVKLFRIASRPNLEAPSLLTNEYRVPLPCGTLACLR
jgi:hypothetical protein